MKQNRSKGITIVALTVTIIVLLILAGISINLTLGENGIITKAKLAKEQYLNAQEAEEQDLATLYNELFLSSTDRQDIYPSDILQDLEELKELLNQQIEKTEKLEEQTGTLGQETEDLKELLQQQLGRIEELEQKTSSLEQQNNSLEGQMNDLKNSLQQQIEKTNELEKQTENLEQQTGSLEGAIDELKKLLQQQIQKTSDLEKKLEKVDTLEQQLEEMKQEIQNLKNDLSSLDEKTNLENKTFKDICKCKIAAQKTGAYTLKDLERNMESNASQYLTYDASKNCFIVQKSAWFYLSVECRSISPTTGASYARTYINTKLNNNINLLSLYTTTRANSEYKVNDDTTNHYLKKGDTLSFDVNVAGGIVEMGEGFHTQITIGTYIDE